MNFTQLTLGKIKNLNIKKKVMITNKVPEDLDVFRQKAWERFCDSSSRVQLPLHQVEKLPPFTPLEMKKLNQGRAIKIYRNSLVVDIYKRTNDAEKTLFMMRIAL
ncbi:MAG: hypothetical protein LBG52_00385 [Candidatus Peribacteria bacterium]|jgi:hypothetical protein|nr:hypothetical protein [Candidatus Peribacteria bacterium]